MKYSGVIIIQGPSQHVNELKKAWGDYKIIWSTWEGDENKYSENDIVIFNKIPTNRGTGNVALQQLTTLNGVLKAKELGYERVLKWRSDMIPTNADEFINLLKLEHINMLFYHAANGGYSGYYVDYFMEGNIDNIYNMWSFVDITPQFPEKSLTNNIREKKLDDIVFIGAGISENNDVVWLKREIKLSSYQKPNSWYITTET